MDGLDRSHHRQAGRLTQGFIIHMHSLPSLRHLSYLVGLAETLNFTKAAQ